MNNILCNFLVSSDSNIIDRGCYEYELCKHIATKMNHPYS